ncbi:polyamine aminopropyltransferase [Clostridium formicaceticum]|uniref:Polyamine aminopropyltransferase n=2 Tax=Clostridium formicaceticum TaxID=1497 RepID=A0AAC9RIU6_9CLOT|nr:polyamine aminopropyltransferase [Clostridium formicaceticum]ARE86349.1 Spermidine synthase [Clostridium formicaceticum]
MPIILNEKHSTGLSMNWTVDKVLYHQKSDFQEVAILELQELGRALALDGAIQVTVKDEFVYNEMITHVPLFTHPNPEKVLIIGGGDGGAAREAAKHPKVKQVDMCEIDPVVIEACREYLPEMSVSYDNPKVNVITKDGIAFIKNNPNTYDVIIIDSSDPVGPAVELFQKQFYTDVRGALKEDGLFVCQSESLFLHMQLIKDVYASISSLFPIARVYTSTNATYPGFLWSYTMGSKRYDPLAKEELEPQTFQTKYYNHDLFKASFALPNFLKEELGQK